MEQNRAKKRPTAELTANPLVAQTTGRMYSNRDKTGDIKFLVAGEIIRAHKCVLAALSPKYEAQFYGDFNDKSSESIEVKDVSVAAFKEFLQLFYLDHINLSHENIYDVLDLVKSSLVDEFFEVCIDFLTKTLSAETACKSYCLAIQYECKNLMDCCEQMIRSNSESVFSSNEFNQCSPAILSNILQFDLLNCKEIVVFDACINWAKNYCIFNGMDASNHQHLREALGSQLFHIRFGTMTFQEFMRCYHSYKNVFTADEREGILYAIGKVADPKSYEFNDEPRDILFKKWDKNRSINCDRYSSFQPVKVTKRFLFGLETTTFSCNQPILLGAISLGALLHKGSSKCPPSDVNVIAQVMIIRKRQLNDAVGKTLLDTTETFTFTTKQQTIFKLQQAIKIRPDFLYEIQVDFKDGLNTELKNFKRQIHLNGSETIIDFHETKGAVTGLQVGICKKEFQLAFSDIDQIILDWE